MARLENAVSKNLADELAHFLSPLVFFILFSIYMKTEMKTGTKRLTLEGDVSSVEFFVTFFSFHGNVRVIFSGKLYLQIPVRK